MAEGSIKLWLFSAGGIGCTQAILKAVPRDCWITSFDDSLLRLAADLLGRNEERDFLLFGELVRRVLSILGGEAKILASRALILPILEADLRKQLPGSVFHDSAQMPGCAPSVWEALHDLSLYGWTSDSLREVAAELGEKQEGSKTANQSKFVEMASAWESVDSKLAEVNRVTIFGLVQHLLQLEANDVPIPRDIIVLYGSEHKPLYDEVLKWLSAHGFRVTVLVEAFEPSHNLFPLSQRLTESLKPKVIVRKDKPNWTANLFTPFLAEKARPELEVWRAPDPLAECEWVLRECIPLVTQGKKIGIYSRNAATYGPLIIATAERLGVGVNVSLNQPLLTNGLARVLSQILQTLSQPDVRKLRRLGGSSYLRCTPSQRDLLQELVYGAHRDKGESWESLLAQVANHENSIPWLLPLLTWRHESASNPASVGEWSTRLEQLVGDCFINDASVEGDEKTIRRDHNAKTVLLRSIRGRCLVDASEKLSLSEFTSTVQAIWQNETYTDRSTALNGIQFVTDTSMASDFDFLAILGLLEGDFPRRRREHPILSDSDLAELNQSGRVSHKLPNSHDRAATEREEFVRLCGSGRERVLFCYPDSDDDTDAVPAFYLHEIKRIRGSESERSLQRSAIVPPPEHCVSPADLDLAQALAEPKQYPDPIEVSNQEIQGLLIPSEDGVQPEELAAALVCPFRAAFRYRLGLSSPSDTLGDFIFVAGMKQMHAISSQPNANVSISVAKALTKRLEEFEDRLQPWQEQLARATIDKFAVDWPNRERETRERIIPLDLENLGPVSFQQGPLIPRVKYGSKEVKLQGEIPNFSYAENRSIAVITIFRRSLGKDSVEKDEEFGHLVRFLALFSGKRNCVIVADAPRGPRLVYGSYKNRAIKATLLDRAESVDLLARSVRPKIQDALDILHRGTAVPKPGLHCENCSLGELCRRHSIFGETESPFDLPSS
ncbi:MAG: hypothetical protein MUC92_01355 [Fimbriimonadaceae bacterium]|jgi:hypothetical protein|nr:hypothetical protein [Fimbriimonadaceae bacterium]